MNARINQHFDAIEEWLLQSASVDAYQLIRKETIQSSGKIRLKVVFTNGDMMELFEYVTVENNDIRLELTAFIGKQRQANLKAVGIMPRIIQNCLTRHIINIIQIYQSLELAKKWMYFMC